MLQKPYCEEEKSSFELKMTCKGEREISAVSRRLPDNLGEFACMNRKLPARLS